jgi:ketosteroid isomerase-like protein
MENPIAEFYAAFHNLDANTMVALYHDNILFEDPAFGTLKGSAAKDMWRMLCASQKGKDFKVALTHTEFFGSHGTATWEAHYIFSRTGRKVHNIVHAQFLFKEGKIIKHIDSFDLYRWARQAMGLKGLLLGWTPYFAKKMRAGTRSLLSQYQKKHSS